MSEPIENKDTWAKWVAGVAGGALILWMSFISMTMIQMNSNLSVLKAEVLWLKNEWSKDNYALESASEKRERTVEKLREDCRDTELKVLRLEDVVETLLIKNRKK